MFKKSWQNPYLIGALLFIFCLLVQGFWLTSFYPGAMTGDSISMWKQSIAGSGYGNLQPYLYTLYMHYLRQVWDSPALIAGVQVVVSAALVSGFSVLMLKKNANKWLIAGGYLAFVFSIPVMITNTIIHRDSFYAGLVLLLSIIFVSLFFQKEEMKITEKIMLGLLLALIASMRYDGAIYLVFAPLLLYIFKLMSRKGALIVLSTALFGYFILQVPLAGLLEIKENRFLQIYNLETEFVATIYRDHPESFSAADLDIMTKVAPLSLWKRYDPADDYFYWAKYDKSGFYLTDFRNDWNQMFFKKIAKYPFSVVGNRYEMTMGLLVIDKINGPGIITNDIGMKQEPLTSRKTRGQLGRLFNDEYLNGFTRFFLWSPLYLLIHISFLTLAVVKKKKYLIAYSVIGLVSFLIVIPLVTSAQFRYMYPLFYSSFFVPALYTLKSRKEEGAVS